MATPRISRTIAFPAGLYERLQVMAAKEERSVTQVVLRAVEQAVRTWEREHQEENEK
jgi:predicted transcriptional regulator